MKPDRRWAAVCGVAVLLSFGGAGCSRPTPPDNAASADAVVTFEVKDGRVGCCALVDLGDSGYLAVGKVDYRDGRTRAWLARMGPAGERQGDHELALPVERAALTAGVVTVTGEIHVVGWGSVARRQRLLVSKLQPDGKPEWIRTSALRLDTKAEGAVVSRDGSLVVAGFTRASGLAGSVFLAGLNRSGDMAWQWPVTDANELPWVSLLESATGGFLVAGMFGITHMEADGRRRWEHHGIDISSVAEDGKGDVFVMGGVLDGPGRSHSELQKLSGRGTLLWRHTLSDLCFIPGSWPSPRGGVIVAGTPCETEDELWLTEVSTEGRAMGVTRLKLPAGAYAYRAAATRDGHVIAAGGFNPERPAGQENPDGLKGWFLKTGRPVRYTK